MTEQQQQPKDFSNPFHSQGADYDKDSPRSIECPHEFTGNASEDWQAFFVAAYRFGKWASTTDIGGAGPSITMTISGHPDEGYSSGDKEAGKYPDYDWELHNIPIDATPGQLWCADGITLRLNDCGWAADVVGHWHELLAALPWGMPDGELEVHFPHSMASKEVNGGRDHMTVLHLWHD